MKAVHSTRLDLNLLEVFEAVASSGSTTLAADRLAISQSAVSHALNRLRDVVGDPLFVRARGALAPTPHAASMVAPVQEVLRSARLLMAPASFDPASSARRFKVGASDYAAVTTVPDLVRRVRLNAPGVVVEMLPIGERVLLELESGELDITFFGAQPPSTPFLSRELFRERFVGLLCARHPLALRAGQGLLSLEDYLAYPHAMVTFRDPRLSPIDAALADIGRTRRIALVTPSFASNVTSLAGTDLLMSIPSRLASSIDSGDLVRFELPLAIPEYPYSIIWHRRTDADPACAWLRLQAGEIEALDGLKGPA
jgi:DNA-binding transcriptional LysR family regulator